MSKNAQKVTPEQIGAYIKKHKEASVEVVAAHFGVCGATIKRNAKKLGYQFKKIWVMG